MHRAEAAVLVRFLNGRSELVRAWNAVPFRQQFSTSSKHEDAEIRCSRRLTKLRSDRPLKISDDKYVAFGVAPDLLRVISRLKPFCRFTHAVSNERRRHSAPYCQVFPDEMNNGDHPVSGIAETKIWNMISNAARLFAISTRRQYDNGDVSIGCRKFLAVDIGEANRVRLAG